MFINFIGWKSGGMSALFDEKKLVALVQERILKKNNGQFILEQLINQAELGKELLRAVATQGTEFTLIPQLVRILVEPKIERLTLVYPESFYFETSLKLSGYFKIKYKTLAQTIPKQVEPFTIVYSGIVITEKESIRFKNERVWLI